MTGTELVAKAIAAWNSSADEYNQWHALGIDEMLELVAKAALAQPTAISDGDIAKIINALRDVALDFHATQQLRERIAHIVVPLLKAAQPVQPSIPKLTDEQDRALCEAHCNDASDEYFAARQALDFPQMRRIFYAGHRKAWISASIKETP